MTDRRSEIEQARRESAKRGLDRAGDSEIIGTSAFARSVDRLSPRPDACASADPAEIWGKRVGRALGLVAVAGLLIYLIITYGFR